VNGELRVANRREQGAAESGTTSCTITVPNVIQIPAKEAVCWSASASEESDRSVDLQGLVGEPTCGHQLYYGSRAGHVHHKQVGTTQKIQEK
jgi:hypothetical protein